MTAEPAVDDNEALREQLEELRALMFPRRPGGTSWLHMKLNGDENLSVWQQGALRVISTVDRIADAPCWHLTVVVMGQNRRASAVEMMRVRKAFGLLDAQEEPRQGNARHLRARVQVAQGGTR
jgi:hypothetical protein